MAQMLEPQAGESIYDPTCGTGGMLISCLAEVKRRGGDTRTTGPLRAGAHQHHRRHRPDEPRAARRVEDFHIASGNTLAAPAFAEGDRLRTFDVVLANPPYSIKKWNREAWESDAWGRNFLGTPPQGRADYAFFQHILKSMDPKTGRCAILFPHGVLFRNEEAEMRRKLVEADLVECVLGLGPEALLQLADGSVRRHLPEQEAESPTRARSCSSTRLHEVARERAQSFLRAEHQERILDGLPGVRRMSPASRPSRRSRTCSPTDGNLSIPRYVKKVKPATVERGRDHAWRPPGRHSTIRAASSGRRWTRWWTCSMASSPRRPTMPE